MTETNVKPKYDLQSGFLKFCINKKVSIETINSNDKKTGFLRSYDKYCLKLEISPARFLLIYKSALVPVITV